MKEQKNSWNSSPGKSRIQPVTVRQLKIGEGIPKICAPVVGVSEEEIAAQARAVRDSLADMAEWRADWFAFADDTKQVLYILSKLRDILKDMPLLFTFRTQKEGGEKPIAQDAYTALNTAVIQSGCADLVDAELFMGRTAAEQLVSAAHAGGVKIILSNHDFSATPDKDEIVSRLCRMQQCGADIAKIAVMPQNRADVLTLLAATEEMYRRYADRPFITMSMAGEGMVSRLCGEVFGSSLTFGTVSRASAPGQIDVEELAHVLALVHNKLGNGF